MSAGPRTVRWAGQPREMNVANQNADYGIANELAPELGVTRWVDPSGQPLDDGFDLLRAPGRYKLLFCFQHACPGCHSSGFPTLQRIVQALHGTDVLSIAVVHTVFEDFEHNTFEAMLEDQRRYALPVPFGHDAGQDQSGSELMRRFGNGGTPWFILIDPNGVVVFNDFRLDADRLVTFLRNATRDPAPVVPPGTFTWRDVLRQVRDGNPPPPRRVERSAAEWRERLTPEQFRVTRERGTERAHSSDMCGLFEPGEYQCVCCGTPLFEASTKFGSKSGWPSFTQAVAPGVVAHLADDSHGMRRVEVACNVCDAHLGHVFPDGPEPTGLRYCINGVALEKKAASAA